MKKKIIVHETADFIHEIIVQIDNEEGEEMVDVIMDSYAFTARTDLDSIVYALQHDAGVIVLDVKKDIYEKDSEITDIDAEDLDDEE